MEKDKKKKRASKYNEKLKIKGTLDDVLRVSTDKKKDKDKKEQYKSFLGVSQEGYYDDNNTGILDTIFEFEVIDRLKV